MRYRRFTNPKVKAVFDRCAPEMRSALLATRELIFQTARDTPGVGKLDECLKWGEPAYLTPETGSGSTVRLAPSRAQANRYAVHFNCNTNLVEQFRLLYPDAFEFAGNRSLLFDCGLPSGPELAHCIAMALTYHLAKRAPQMARPISEAKP